MAYLDSVHRIVVDNSTGEPISGAEWAKVPSMIQERSDHACALAQFKWEKGILVAGMICHIFLDHSMYHKIIRDTNREPHFSQFFVFALFLQKVQII